MATFGENVRRVRERRGLQGNELARLVDVAPSVVSGWEKNRRGLPETPTLFKLAKALDCSVEELLVGVDAEYERAVARRAARAERWERWLQTQPKDRHERLRAFHEQTERRFLEMPPADLIRLEASIERHERFMTPARQAIFEQHRHYFGNSAFDKPNVSVSPCGGWID